MKKLTLLLALILVLSSLFSFGVSAATKQDVVDVARGMIPAGYNQLYLIQIENIFSQLDVSAETCDKLIVIAKEVDNILRNNGYTLSNYTAEDRKNVIAYMNQVCDLTGLTYQYNTADLNNIQLNIYDPAGNLIGQFEFDQDQLINKTDVAVAPVVSFALPISAIAILAAAAFVFAKSRKAAIA